MRGLNSKNSCWCVFLMTIGLVLPVRPNLVASGCPKGCETCNDGDGYSENNISLVKAACRGNKWMTEVPADLPTVIGTLRLTLNAVKIIKTSSFEPYKYLKDLDLTSNEIENIENGSFRHQKYLVNLDLKNNRLTSLTPEMFLGLHSLKKLDLENNLIASLSKGVFSSLTELTFLDLHDNKIANIEKGAFDSLDYLEEITMGGCQLKKLQAGSFGNLMSLRTIDLSFNMIESIDPETFSCSPLIETLHLNDNDLKYVPRIVFSKLRLLKDLDLSKNALMFIRSKAFIHNQNLEILNLGFCRLGFLQEGAFDGLKNLRELSLNGNPLDCDCRMRWLLHFWKEAESKGIFQEPGQTNCTSPQDLSGKPLMDLLSTDFKCNCTTCIKDALCNGVKSACAPCSHRGVVESCNCSRPISCHSYNGRCLCSYAVPKPTSWNCTYDMTNQTCDRNARLAVVNRRNISCLCNKGFRGDGIKCEDINECADTTNRCRHLHRLCRNTYGSYQCYCKSGYKDTVMGCQDINECDSKPCLGPSYCHNNLGSYSCECKSSHASVMNVCRPVPNKVSIRVHDVQATSVMVSWSNITDNRDAVRFLTILYRAFGTSSSEWSSAPETYTPDTTRAVVEHLTPDTYYTIKVELNLVYNTSIPSDVEKFQTKELPTKGKSSGSDGDRGVVIVTSSVVGSAVAIAIALSLVAFFLKRKKPNTGEEGPDTINRPYLQDLVEMRMFSSKGTTENIKMCARMDAWEVPRDMLKVGEKIGEGQFGIVLKGTLTTSEGPVKVAIKTIKGVDRFDMKDFMQEMDMMKEIGYHPNVVSLLGVSSIGAPLYIITEYVDGGNLLDLLRSSRRTDGRYTNMTSTLNSRQLLRIALDVSKGMSHIALKKLVHRDLAARNVLMTTDLVAKIADFGLARDIYCEGMYVKTGGGRLPIKWMAPDAIRDQTYTIKSDVWSFGILLWEIVTLGGSPYSGIPVNILLEKLLYGYRMSKPEHCAQEVYTIMEDCWALDPSMRPSFDDLCEALSLLLAEEGHIYINIRATEAEQMGAGSSGSKEEESSL